MYVYVYIYIYTYIYVHTSISTYIKTHTCVCVCVCVHPPMYPHIQPRVHAPTLYKLLRPRPDIITDAEYTPSFRLCKSRSDLVKENYRFIDIWLLCLLEYISNLINLWTTLNLLFSPFVSPTSINKRSRSDDWLLCLKYRNLHNHGFEIYLPGKRFSIAMVRNICLFSYKLITTRRLYMNVRIGTENSWKTFITQTLCLAFVRVVCSVKQDAETRKLYCSDGSLTDVRNVFCMKTELRKVWNMLNQTGKFQSIQINSTIFGYF